MKKTPGLIILNKLEILRTKRLFNQLFFLMFMISFFWLISCNGHTPGIGGRTELIGDYLGEAIPSDTALIFAPGLVSTGLNERDFAITRDGNEIFFSRDAGDYRYTTIFHSQRTDGKWSRPEVFELFRDARYKYLEPHMSPEGNRLYFISNMPADSSSIGNEDIWYTELTDGKWSRPVNIGFPVNTALKEYFPSLTAGGTIYYTHPDSITHEEFIYRSRRINGIYQKPERLGPEVNIGRARYNAFIAPDESFIIVPAYGMADSYGGTDYYIVFRDTTDRWSKALNMGDEINSRNPEEWSAALTTDGKFLFFMSSRMDESPSSEYSEEFFNKLHLSPRNGNTDIYWISSSVIEKLRSQAVFE